MEVSVPRPLTVPANVIPFPAYWKEIPGHFALTARTTVSYDGAVRAEAEILLSRLRLVTGFPLPVNDLSPTIVVRIDPDCLRLGAEGYRLSVTPDRVEIRAARPAGIFYATQTLLQLMPVAACAKSPQEGQLWSIACVEIEDTPRFSWRGAMLDVSRHFMPIEFLRKFIDALAMHKLNVLQLHLNDDQAWRIEILKYPKLTEVGSRRRETLVGYADQSPADAGFDPARQHFDGVPHEGYYTQREMRELVEYARVRNVSIVPEIEMPGHATSAIAAYPELGCLDCPVEVSPTWGIHANLFNAEESTILFLQDVLREVVDVFPSYYIHVGGDEAVKAQWRESAACQRRIRELGLQNEAELQSYMIRRMDEFLSGQGRRLVGWDEILEGGLAQDAVVMSWRGDRGGIAAAKMGHDVVMAPYQHTYLDYYQAVDYGDEPPAFPEVVTLEQIYRFDPLPGDLPAEFSRHILGAQGQLWTEYMPTSAQVEYMAFPRLAALAEGVWSAPEAKDYAGFMARLSDHLTRLGMMGINYRRPTDTDYAG